ncbi:MAG: monovalent cation:proton antiporter-2 (CPA2) family protein [Alphaproteobacteria bacterium]
MPIFSLPIYSEILHNISMHTPEHLLQIVILLLAAVLIVGTFRKIHLSPVLGYLVAGAMIGPFGLNLIQGNQEAGGVAEFGVIFLLFIIGMELSFERLRSMRTHVFGFGGAQFVITTLVIALLIVGFGGDAPTAIIVASGLALSSTAIVLQVVAEQSQKSTQVGRLALATLIMQDLAVIPLLVLVSIVNEGGSLMTAIAEASLKTLFALTFIFVVGRKLLRPLFRLIASMENTELFTATTMLVVLGVATATSMAGLSPALGAFLAGLLVAETEFKPQVESDILPFKQLLLGFFFMYVGMTLNIDMLLEQFLSIIGITTALMLFKALVIMILARMFGFSLSTAIYSGLLLSQGSEFAFILFSLAGEFNIIHNDTAQILLVVVTTSMALTPLVAQAGRKIGGMLESHAVSRPSMMMEETLDLSNHVIISGFGRVGHTVARLLEAEDIPYAAVDIDSFLVAKERKMGMPSYYGDTTRRHVLNALGIARARAVIITHADIRVALQTILTVREKYPTLPIIARAKNIEQVMKLEQAGATLAIAEMFETSLQLSGALLKELGVSDYEITRIIEIFRAEDYALTRSAEKTPDPAS